MLVTDGKGRRWGGFLARAKRAEIRLAGEAMDAVRVPRPGGCPASARAADRGQGVRLRRLLGLAAAEGSDPLHQAAEEPDRTTQDVGR